MIAECICFISEARILVAAMSASALTLGFGVRRDDWWRNAP